MRSGTRLCPPYVLAFAAFFNLLIYLSCASVTISSKEKAPEQDLLDLALEAVAMKRTDLSIRPDLSPNPFALNRFRRWMENPVKAPSEAGRDAAGLLGKAVIPDLWLAELAGLGDISPLTPLILSDAAYPQIPPDLPEQVRRAVRTLLIAVAAGNAGLAAVKGVISPREMKAIEGQLYPDFCRAGEAAGPAGLKDLREAIAAAGKVDRKGILEVGVTLLDALSEARNRLAEREKWGDTVRSCSFMTPLGRVEIGGKGPDVHEDDAFLIIDLGGNDLYRGKVASGGNGTCALVLDLEGDDIYLGEAFTQASGFWGVGILFDLEGDDLYSAKECAQGAGLFGMGLLMDGGGSDTYLGKAFVQGASAWGWGGLIDMAGEDTYRCHRSGQAYAGVLGVASLCDLEGNDKYLSGMEAPDPREPDMNQSFSQGFAMGMRNVAAGGLALLADRSGNDIYQCRYFGQGASYWMGVGILYDEDGKDTYIARRYAQGAGIHFSLGLHLDAGGDDHTFSWGVSQGCGHDYGIGILLNETGRDTYVSDWLSMGASEANGVGIFVDNTGDDGYETKTAMAVGRLTESRRAGGIGLFMDAGGKDRYSRNGPDNSLWGANRWSAGIDREAEGRSGLRLLPHEKTVPAGEKGRERKGERESPLSRKWTGSEDMPYPDRVEALLSVASHWGFDKETPEKAGKELLDLDPERSVPAMADLLDTPDIMGLIFMDRFFTVHAYHAVRALIPKAEAADPVVRSRALYQLGRLRDSRALETCVRALDDPSWRVRTGALRAIGEILDKGRLDNLIPMKEGFEEALKGEDPRVLGDYLAGKEKGPMVLSVLARALPLSYETFERFTETPPENETRARPDDFARFVYRHLEDALPLLQRWIGDIRRSGDAAARVMGFLDDPDPSVQRAAAYALGQLRHLPALPSLIGLLKAPHLWVRDAAALSLALYGDEVLPPLARAVKRETPAFRILAVDVLSRIGTEAARRLIKDRLKDPDPNVRRAAERAVSEIKR
jgi:HEAT repeat protein